MYARRYIIYVTTLPNFCQAEKNGHRTGTERNEGKERHTQRREKEKKKRDESWKKKKRQKPLCEREA